MWDLDAIGITTSGAVELIDPVLSGFEETITFKEGRYEVSLPWKTKLPAPLLSNRPAAVSRLLSLQRRLNKDVELAGQYDSAFQELEECDIVEEVGSGSIVPPGREIGVPPVYYMSHHPVVKAGSTTTKVRPVFDASASGPNGVSLNDCLEAGPCLLPALFDVLLRFRRWPVALTADIRKAFLQIRVREEDRDVHRFLYLSARGEFRDLRFTRVPFGNKSSPFLLNATIRHHLARQTPSVVVDELKANLYVDDWLSGADTVEEASRMFVDARAIMAEAAMPLVKWQSNSHSLLDVVSQETGRCLLSEQNKILGVRWCPEADAFSFDGSSIPDDLMPTKRVVLSCIMRLYDPLGLMLPFVMTAKILFQEGWRLGFPWDEFLPDGLADRFQGWLRGLNVLRSWQVPRQVSFGCAWKGLPDPEIHVFCDASESAYGAACYLAVMVDGCLKFSLVTAKARVAPLKRVILPRLELLGCLVGCRLLNHVCAALDLLASVPRFHWTDSMVALGWIQGEPSRWKEFVANRVREIQDLSDPASWRHVPGIHNPADLLTRGTSAEQLISNSMWLGGPDPDVLTTAGHPDVDVPAVVLSLEELSPVLLAPAVVTEAVVDLKRFSTWIRATRVLAWVKRFAKNARWSQDQIQGEMTLEELKKAELDLVRIEQRVAYPQEYTRLAQGQPVLLSSPIVKLSPGLGDDGLIRVQGRFLNCPLRASIPLSCPRVTVPSSWFAPPM
jgi:hypothetical protein